MPAAAPAPHPPRDPKPSRRPLGLYDQYVAGDCPRALPVCTVRIGDRDVIIVRDIITADPDRGRDDLAAYLTDLFVDLTGDELGAPALRPARQPVHLNRGHLMATGAPRSRTRTGPGAARTHRPGAVLAATGSTRVFPSPARWALSIAGARRCVPLARSALPGAMPTCGGYFTPAHPPVLRPCQRGRRKVGPGSPAPLSQ